MYAFPAHTVSGTVNFVTINAVVKSDTYSQSTNGVCKLLMNVGTCITEWKSADFELATSYKKIQSTHGELPTELGGTSWTWTDIDNLEVGIEVSSPTVDISADIREAPDADCSGCTHLLSTGVTHYTEIDEYAPSYTDYVYTEDNWVEGASTGTTGSIEDICYSSPTFFVANSEGISVFTIADGVYTAKDFYPNSNFNDDVEELWYDSSGCTLYVGVDSSGTNENFYALKLGWFYIN